MVIEGVMAHLGFAYEIGFTPPFIPLDDDDEWGTGGG